MSIWTWLSGYVAGGALWAPFFYKIGHWRGEAKANRYHVDRKLDEQ